MTIKLLHRDQTPQRFPCDWLTTFDVARFVEYALIVGRKQQWVDGFHMLLISEIIWSHI